MTAPSPPPPPTCSQNPAESNEETDRRLADQFGLLSAALRDDAPAVRAAAVAGVCRILNGFWELIPAAVTAGYIKLIAGAHRPPACLGARLWLACLP